MNRSLPITQDTLSDTVGLAAVIGATVADALHDHRARIVRHVRRSPKSLAGSLPNFVI